MQIISEIGNRYGRLVVVDFVGMSKDHRAVWLCKCDCGNMTKVKGRYLRSGDTTSCGCRWKETLAEFAGYPDPQIHGGSKDNLYTLWRSMKKRCKNPTRSNACYRGIKVCKEWEYDYGAFRDWALANGYVDMRTEPFKARLSIDRIDPFGDYSPENCRFITVSENSTRANIARYHGNTEVTPQMAQG